MPFQDHRGLDVPDNRRVFYFRRDQHDGAGSGIAVQQRFQLTLGNASRKVRNILPSGYAAIHKGMQYQPRLVSAIAFIAQKTYASWIGHLPSSNFEAATISAASFRARVNLIGWSG